LSGEEIELDEQEFHGLRLVHLYDWLEQVPRSREWNYRRQARRALAERPGGFARESFARVDAHALV
jgi:hypothetical protein